MKHFVLLLFSFACFNSTLSAQVDIKMDPISLILSKNIKGGVELALTEEFSLDIDGLYSGRTNIPIPAVPSIPWKSYGTRIIGKYYLSPKYSHDRFYFGAYLKYRNNRGNGFVHNRATFGMISGLKFFVIENFYMELGFGMGRRFYSSLKNPVGDFIDGLLDEPIVEGVVDYFSRGIGKVDFTSRLLLGYRIKGIGPRSTKEQEKIITP